jgi:hypothetical protein
MKYAVWSTHVPEEGEPVDVLEVTRTDRSVANNDRMIIQEIFHRKAWVHEVES